MSHFLKGIIAGLLMLFQLSSKGQVNPGNQEAWWDVYYGYRISNQVFYNQLNTINYFKFGSPLQIMGVRWKINSSGNHKGLFEKGHMGYSQILPQTIVVQDTLKGKITGGFFNFALGYHIETQVVRLIIYLGFNTGQLNIFKNDLIRQKNPMFAPKIGIQPWFLS